MMRVPVVMVGTLQGLDDEKQDPMTHSRLTIGQRSDPVGTIRLTEHAMELSNPITQLTGGGSDGWEVFYRARQMAAAG